MTGPAKYNSSRPKASMYTIWFSSEGGGPHPEMDAVVTPPSQICRRSLHTFPSASKSSHELFSLHMEHATSSFVQEQASRSSPGQRLNDVPSHPPPLYRICMRKGRSTQTSKLHATIQLSSISISRPQPTGSPIDGTSDGRREGIIEGTAEGNMVGVSEGVADGPTEASTDGFEEGDGDGIMVGEHTGGSPFGCMSNIGLLGRHSYGQHMGQPSGNGSMSQSGLLTSDPLQSPGRLESEYGRKHASNGHRSRTSSHSEGIILGVLLGFWVSFKMTAATVGSADGTGDGSGVGLQSILS
mmetsp:Transcript_31339/g.75468  ORF Transcript_31339/g.75468 Transcript_31339/m.75468 type:complete len:298 (+) Transcript_31339:1328-2221(+)